MRLIDLTLTISEDLPVYPGDPEVKFRTYESEGFWVSEVRLGSHTGTHIDVPRHVNPQGQGVDEVPLERLSGWGTVIDARGMEIVEVQELPEAEIILFYTGSNADLERVMRGKYSVLSEGLAERISKSKVKLVGIDSPSVGSLKVHRALLDKGIIIVENLSSRLEELLGKKFFFVAAPIPLKGLDGAPARAFAILFD